MPKTGNICRESGIYEAQCSHRTQVALTKGDPFPPCGGAPTHGPNWVLLRAVRN